MNMRIWFVSVYVTLVVALLMGGCQAPTPQVITKEVEKPVVQTVVVEKEKVVEKPVVQTVVVEKRVERPKLTVWQESSFIQDQDFKLQSYLRDFCAANNCDLDLVYDSRLAFEPKWKVAIETKRVPDVAFARSPDLPARLHLADLALDVSDVVSRLDKLGGGFNPIALAAFSFDGKMYAVPWGVHSDVLHIRKDMLDEAGVAIPDTWEELIAAAKKVTKPGKVYGLGLDFGPDSNDDVHLQNILLDYGAAAWSKDGQKVAINSPETIKVLEMIRDAWKAGIFPPDSVTWAGSGNNTCFLTSACAIVWNSASLYGTIETTDKKLLENTVLHVAPKGPAGRFIVQPFYGWMAAKATKYPDLAKGMIEYVMAPDRQKTFIELGKGQPMPVYRDHLKLSMWDKPAQAVIRDNAAFAVNPGYPGPLTLWAQEADRQAVIPHMFVRVLVDNWAPDQAAKEAEEKLQKIYATFNK